ncbi:MAG: hypothetical protein AAFU55_12165, partial [Pseudomonadota bacterium]
MRDSPVSKNYVIVTAQGRSGSNMLLDVLNESPHTICRNEPDALIGSPLKTLPDGFFDEDFGPDFPEALEAALADALLRDGVRDNFSVAGKTWFRSPLRAAIGQEALRNRRLRRVLGAVFGEYRNEEWRRPDFYQDRSALERALPVYKILLVSGWLTRSHSAHSGQKVLHIVREPLSFLHSWRNRYVAVHTSGEEEVYAANMKTTQRILDHFDAKSNCGDGFSEENLIETELWRWRYMNEVLLAALGSSDRYKILRFEDVRARSRE